MCAKTHFAETISSLLKSDSQNTYSSCFWKSPTKSNQQTSSISKATSNLESNRFNCLTSLFCWGGMPKCPLQEREREGEGEGKRGREKEREGVRQQSRKLALSQNWCTHALPRESVQRLPVVSPSRPAAVCNTRALTTTILLTTGKVVAAKIVNKSASSHGNDVIASSRSTFFVLQSREPRGKKGHGTHHPF